MRIVIAGIGWLGLPLASQLLKNGHDCAALSSQSNLPVPRIGWEDPYPHHADILISLFPPLIKQQKTELHHRVVSFAKRNGIPQLFYSSSTSIYTNQMPELSESDADPQSDQASIEAIYKSFGTGAHMLRLGGLMGPDRNPGRFYAAKAVPDPEGFVNFVHRTDAVNAIEHLCAHRNLIHGDYNIVSPIHPTRWEFFSAFAQRIGEPAPTAGEYLGKAHKTISAAKLIQSGFSFRYKNPIEAVDAC